MKNIISEQSFSKERSLYNINNATIFHCNFAGEEDGESPLKECSNLLVKDCNFKLRYPLWHNDYLNVENCSFLKNSRAAIWYSKNVKITHCNFEDVKLLRECSDINIDSTVIKSDEFGWKNNNLTIFDCNIISEYALFLSKNVTALQSNFVSKYAFQYMTNSKFEQCYLVAKDGFWHAENVTIKDCYIDGEFLGWYSNHLTLINCQIKGSQPFCYCKNLTLINCTMIDCDLAFEYSDVKAKINGKIHSIKNPLSGKIECDDIDKIISDDDKYPNNCEIVVTKYAKKD